ncbi:MAG: hypothetical protein HKN47_25420 [Pirellulaceae bacterium]|nr:hypothetical protein [Pirellulaceae bacterium]
MRKIAIGSAVCALLLIATSASAKDDFSALLSELNYGEPTATTQVVPQYTTVSNEVPSTTLSMPNLPGKINARVAVASKPTPAQTVGYSVGSNITNSFAGGGCAVGGCASGACGGTGCNGNCGGHEGGYCVPHTVPNLPTSTLRQYWRSNSCNCTVWDGYQNTCHGAPKAKKKKWCLFGSSGCNDSAACGAASAGCSVIETPVCAPAGCASGAVESCAPAAGCDGQAGCDVPASAPCDAPSGCDAGGCAS